MDIEIVPIEDMSDSIEDEDIIKKRFRHIIEYFKGQNPNPTTELKHENPYQLLVAVILSAQCTDKRVNIVTPGLFVKYPTLEDLAKATPEDVYSYIGSVTYPNNKSEYLVRMAKVLMDKRGGKIPEDENELQKLPGVGRKTANVIASTLFNRPVLAVDTHVFRVSERIGLSTGAQTAINVEEQITKYTPKDIIPKMSHWLILHGRYICTARNPQCKKCKIKEVCRYYDVYYGDKKK